MRRLIYVGKTQQLHSSSVPFFFALSKIRFSHNTAHLLLIIPGFGTTATTASSGGLFGTATPSGGGLFGSSSTTGRGNFSVYGICCENNCHQSFRLCMFQGNSRSSICLSLHTAPSRHMTSDRRRCDVMTLHRR